MGQRLRFYLSKIVTTANPTPESASIATNLSDEMMYIAEFSVLGVIVVIVPRPVVPDVTLNVPVSESRADTPSALLLSRAPTNCPPFSSATPETLVQPHVAGDAVPKT